MKIDREVLWLRGGILILLLIASIVTALLRRRCGDTANAVIENLTARVRAWWVMVAVFGLALLTGGTGSVVLFAAISFLALREYITLTPTRRRFSIKARRSMIGMAHSSPSFNSAMP